MNHDNHQLVRDFFVAISMGELGDELLTNDMTMWASSSGKTVDKMGAQQAMKLLASIAKGGINYEVVSLTSEDDRVVAEIKSHGVLINDDVFENWHMMIFTIRDQRIAKVKEYVNAEVVKEKIHPLLFKIMAASTES